MDSRSLFGALALLTLLGCSGPKPIFEDVAPETGLDWSHVNGMSGKFYIAEIMGSGSALFDYDGDGDLDIFLVQGAIPEPDRAELPTPAQPLTDRLFRNDLITQGARQAVLSFTDVTQESGIRGSGYGMGVTAGDYDGDGDVDLYVTNLGPNQLWRNNGDGTFTEVAEAAGAGDDRWSVSAAFTDVDHDGLLDLYIGNYLDFTWATNKVCFNAIPNYCNPLAYPTQPDRLLRNRGDGTFEDITQKAGMAEHRGAALGIVAADLNGDRATDLYVANDGEANFLWINQGDGTFRENALLSGAALNGMGEPEASMGIDAGDFDGDGDLDLFMTHLAGESNTLYVNNGKGFFEDRANQSGLAGPSQAFTGFGTAWFDYDNDGWLDLLAVNGAVQNVRELLEAGDPYPLHQPNQLFHNLGDGRFAEVTQAAGRVFTRSLVSRGSAFGDVDNDGDTDVLITNNNGPVELLLNQIGNRAHWLGVALKLRSEGAWVSGATVRLEKADGRILWRRARIEASYASANDPRVLFGLGNDPNVVKISVVWPDGNEEVWTGLQIDRWHTLIRGQGSAHPN